MLIIQYGLESFPYKAVLQALPSLRTYPQSGSISAVLLIMSPLFPSPWALGLLTLSAPSLVVS